MPLRGFPKGPEQNVQSRSAVRMRRLFYFRALNRSSGRVEVSRAAEIQRPGKPPDAFHKFKSSVGRRALLRWEAVSGFRAVSAVSAAPRFARGQCYLKTLALGARSCSFAIPKFREESLFGVASAARLLLLVRFAPRRDTKS